MPTPWGDLIAAGTQIVGGIMQSNASESAKDAQIHGNMQAAQTLARATEEARTLQGPGVQAYYTGLNALTGRLGLPTQGVSAATRSASQSAGADFSAYGAQYPDLQAEGQRAVNAGEFSSLNDYYRWHWQNKGQSEGRTLPNPITAGQGGSTAAPAGGGAGQMDMSNPAYFNGGASGGSPTAAPATGGGATGGNALTGTSPGTFGNNANPSAPTYTPPPSYQTPAYEAPTFDKTYEAPTYQAPGEFAFSIADFVNNPAFKFAMEQGSGQVMANAAATGARQSGAALKRLQDRGQQTAYQFYAPERDAAFARYTNQRDFGRGTFESDRDFGYGAYRDERGDFENDRSFARGTYQDDRDFSYGQSIDNRNFGYGQYRDQRGDYENDRNYLTNRYDRQTDDLFRYTSGGQNSVTAVTNAALGQGSDNAAGIVATGQARGENALTQGNIWSNVAGNIAGLGSSYLNSRGGNQNALNADIRASAAANPYLF